jgi:hydrogenase maturation protein HypF
LITMTQHGLPPEPRSDARTRQRIVVRGAVQGVGFRPFIHGQATARGLWGWVRNAPEGVIIEVEGTADRVAGLVRAIREAPPAHARVADMAVRDIAPTGEAGFAIRASETGGARQAEVLPDLATCDACLAELLNPTDRRYRYPFINCTHCGPRYSLVEDMPYDRARTAMRRFAMCPACQAEYDDPANRRFHAEPNACPECGPRLALWDRSGAVLARDDAALLAAAAALREGRIVGVKGIGGFHLLVDARNDEAVRSLRQRKRREEKPFAVMFPDLAAVQGSCRVEAEEQALLTGPAGPIVLLRRIGGPVVPSVATDNPRLGALLPYAPLHHMLMRELRFPVVATSGNVTDEPIVTDETEALDRLGGIADLFLVHDRPIVRPVDDSVAQVVCGEPQILRRGRGYAPAPVAAGDPPDGILAFGGHLKAAAALTVGSNLVLGQHVGDLETVAARDAYGRALDDLPRLHGVPARIAVCDAHPDYASSHAAEASGLPLRRVQHHLAHVAACMAEHGLAPPVLGVAWDGSGAGPDGTVWGGEFLLVAEYGWRRAAHLRPFRLPGGEIAVREPRRAALGLLFAAFGEEAFAMTDLAPVTAFAPAERTVLQTMLARGVNAPVTTSAGRLFDAFAALCGIRQRSGYEGQAAAALEWAADGRESGLAFDLPLIDADEGSLVIDWVPALVAALAMLRDGAPSGAVSEALHNGLARAIAVVARRIRVPQVALTGGCFQNRRLTETAVATLAADGFAPFWHRRVPPNDGGLAVGQAAWAAWRESGEDAPCA